MLAGRVALVTGASRGIGAAISEVLEKLNRTVRAAYLDAQPEVDGSVLVLWFRYGFHHKKAQEQSAQLMPHVRAWLGDPGFRPGLNTLCDFSAVNSTPTMAN